MSVFQAFVLGLVQGVAEFLPISSSGFLILIPDLFDWEIQDLAFDAFLHLASLAAIVVALWPDILSILRGRSRLGAWIALATIPALVVGFFFQKVIEAQFRSAHIVAWSLIVWGIVLYLADRSVKPTNDRVEHVGLKRALAIGCAQAIALIPGTSRSGITITAGLFGGLSRETAARFSFLLAIPVIAAAGLLKLGEVIGGDAGVTAIPLAVGFGTTFFAALLTIKLLLAFLKRYSFAEIAVFRVLVGLVVLLVG